MINEPAIDQLIDKLGDKYAGLLEDAEEAGLFHPNCIHSFGISETIAELYESED